MSGRPPGRWPDSSRARRLPLGTCGPGGPPGQRPCGDWTGSPRAHSPRPAEVPHLGDLVGDTASSHALHTCPGPQPTSCPAAFPPPPHPTAPHPCSLPSSRPPAPPRPNSPCPQASLWPWGEGCGENAPQPPPFFRSPDPRGPLSESPGGSQPGGDCGRGGWPSAVELTRGCVHGGFSSVGPRGGGHGGTGRRGSR